MKLFEMTWPEVEAISREVVVVIPTGSLEQHGPHLPLFTDSLIVTAVAQAVESNIPNKIVLVPTVWLGASAHHLSFAGTLSASMKGYVQTIESLIESMLPHGFRKFYVLNGHGGNSDPNLVALRDLKHRFPQIVVAHGGYHDFITEAMESMLTGPSKSMQHACEAETSLMLHLHTNLVRVDQLRDDGLIPQPDIKGLIHNFDEITEHGSFGFATMGTAEKGAILFSAAVEGCTHELNSLADGYVLVG